MARVFYPHFLKLVYQPCALIFQPGTQQVGMGWSHQAAGNEKFFFDNPTVCMIFKVEKMWANDKIPWWGVEL